MKAVPILNDVDLVQVITEAVTNSNAKGIGCSDFECSECVCMLVDNCGLTKSSMKQFLRTEEGIKWLSMNVSLNLKE